jgi:uncharacterized oxidoreductase
MVTIKVENLIDFVANVFGPAAGVDAVLIPGEPEARMRTERTRNGVPLPDDTWAAIVNTARDVGVSEVSIQRTMS